MPVSMFVAFAAAAAEASAAFAGSRGPHFRPRTTRER